MEIQSETQAILLTIFYFVVFSNHIGKLTSAAQIELHIYI